MRSVRFLVGGMVLTLGVYGAARAQSGHGSVDGEVEVRAATNLTSQQKREAARKIVEDAQALSSQVGLLLEGARREADMIRVTCLMDKLTQIDGHLGTARDRLGSLEDATDSGLIDHEFTVISVLEPKFKTLGQEASQCIGQALYDTTSSTNDTTVNENQAGGSEDGSALPPEIAPVFVGAIPPASPVS